MIRDLNHNYCEPILLTTKAFDLNLKVIRCSVHLYLLEQICSILLVVLVWKDSHTLNIFADIQT